MPKLGAHISITGGFAKAIDRGEQAGCDTIQIFTKSNRQWAASPIADVDAESFLERRKTSAIDPVFVHTSYLINVCALNPETMEKSVAALIDELERAAKLQLPFVVLHPGSYTGGNVADAVTLAAKNIDRVIESTKRAKVKVAIENTAGQGTALGTTFEQIADLLDQIENKDRTCVCLDSCHLFAAGYDISAAAGYKKTISDFDRIVGLDRLAAIHLNDSKGGLGSHLDRHEHIGAGKIGLEGFAHFVNDRRLAHVPMVVETPKDNDIEDDMMNLTALRQLIKGQRS